MNNKTIFFITLISPFEEVFKEKKIDSKKIERELKKIENLDLTPFLKKIRRRQEISKQISQSISVYNPNGEEKGFRKSKASMFFFSKKEAEDAIKTNYADLLEGGSWGSPTFVVIEEYSPGFCIVKNRSFYKVEFKKNKLNVRKIKDPKWSRGSVNYAF